MTKDDEKKLAEQLDRELLDDSAWETVPEASGTKRETLGSQVTVRLDSEHAQRLRRIAHSHSVGYTSLLRAWIIERLEQEDRALISSGRLQTAGSATDWVKEFTYQQTPGNRIAVEAA